MLREAGTCGSEESRIWRPPCPRRALGIGEWRPAVGATACAGEARGGGRGGGGGAQQGFSWAALWCTGLHWAALGCTGLHWAALGCTGRHWPALGGTGWRRREPTCGPQRQCDSPRSRARDGCGGVACLKHLEARRTLKARRRSGRALEGQAWPSARPHFFTLNLTLNARHRRCPFSRPPLPPLSPLQWWPPA